MIGEINIAGVFFSPLILCLLAAFFARLIISKMLWSAGFYKVVWHRPLFDMSLFLILVGAAFFLLRVIAPPRSYERRVGNAWGGTCSYRGSPYHYNINRHSK